MKPLEPLTEKLKALPKDERGYPVPFFVSWQNGKPNFTIADSAKWMRAVKENLCWVCGQHMFAYKAFVVGPMCGLNRTSGEPPSHQECAEWSARNCPFLANPNMKRNEIKAMGGQNPGGIMIERNPGVSLVWITKKYTPFNAGNGYLIQIGEPSAIKFYAEGRAATKEEVIASIQSGLPLLQKVALEEDQEKGNDRATKMLDQMTDEYFHFIERNFT